MSQNLLIHGEAVNATLEGMLAVEQFLNDKYLLPKHLPALKAFDNGLFEGEGRRWNYLE